MTAATTGSTAVVLLAGGSGTRMQQAENKVYLEVGGRTLLARSLEVFQRSDLVDELVLVVREGDEDRARSAIDEVGASKVSTLTLGGATRHDSEEAGLEAIAERIEQGEIALVLIHDAARPFVTQELLSRIVRTAREAGGAVPGLPLEGEVLLRASEDGSPPAPVPTDDLRRVQTPQAFHAQPLLEAYRRAAEVGFQGVDTAQSVERFADLEVEVVPGDSDNVKVTYVQDLVAAEELARSWAARGE